MLAHRLRGSSRAVIGNFFGRLARDPEGPRPGAFHFFTPRGPRVTFNTNLKGTRAPARNIPRFKPVICPAGTRLGPCGDPPGTRGQFLKKKTRDTRPAPYWNRAGACGVLTWLLRDPGGIPPVPLYDVRAGPGRDPCRDPCIISRGIHSYWETNLSMFNQSIHL